MKNTPKKLSKEEITDCLSNRLVLATASLIFFAVDVLSLEASQHHKTWTEIIKSEKYLKIECARDHGKTYFYSFAYPLWRAIDTKTNILIISYSQKQSIDLTTHIMRELELNPFFREFVPANRSETWTKTDMTLANGSTIECASFGATLRGGHYDLIIVDDPTKDFGGMNRDDQKSFFYRVIMPTLNPDGKIIVVGTPVDFDDLLMDLDANALFKKFSFPAINPDGTALWASRWSLDKLMERKSVIGSFNFAREYLLQRISPETAPLKTADLQYWHDWASVTKEDKLDKPVNIFMTVDPAISKEPGADHTGIIIGGVDYKNDLYLADMLKDRLDPAELIKTIFDFYAKWKPIYIGIETVAFQKVLKYWLRDEGERRKINLPIVEIKNNTQSKDQRIMSLQPRMEAHKLFIHPSMLQFREEVEKFRLGVNGSDDLLDAAASLNQLINKAEPPKPMQPVFLAEMDKREYDRQKKFDDPNWREKAEEMEEAEDDLE